MPIKVKGMGCWGYPSAGGGGGGLQMIRVVRWCRGQGCEDPGPERLSRMMRCRGVSRYWGKGRGVGETDFPLSCLVEFTASSLPH